MRIRQIFQTAFVFLLVWASCLVSLPAQEESSDFLVKPYIQLGNTPHLASPEKLELMWETPGPSEAWSVQVKTQVDSQWRDAAPPRGKTISLPGHKRHELFKAELDGLVPGGIFQYRILKNRKPVFEASAKARKAANQPYRFIVFGDCGAGTRSQRAVAYQAYKANPDLVVVPGDIIYKHGTVGEYMLNYFPVYNSENASPETGAPLLRSVLFVAAPGNHDIDIANGVLARDLNVFPDGLGYFLFWSQPLNGPLKDPGAKSTPVLIGKPQLQKLFLEAAGNTYPRMANFSFDYGNSHWLVLDADDYMDWTDARLRAWVSADLAAAHRAAWRFVVFHQPGFNSDPLHMIQQRMRLLHDVFERGNVDLVFSGHAHNYQRTYPLHFAVDKQPDGKLISPDGAVAGQYKLDHKYDGATVTRPDGIIYIVSGAGGARLGGQSIAADPSRWQGFTYRFIAEPHSLTVCDVNGKRLSIRQLSKDGAVLDSFTVTK